MNTIGMLASSIILTLAVGAMPASQALEVNGSQPCPTIVQMGSSATLVCDDGSVTFDLGAMTPREEVFPFVKAGSHTVRAAIIVDDELRVWYDPVKKSDDGRYLTSRITILNMKTGKVTQMGY